MSNNKINIRKGMYALIAAGAFIGGYKLVSNNFDIIEKIISFNKEIDYSEYGIEENDNRYNVNIDKFISKKVDKLDDVYRARIVDLVDNYVGKDLYTYNASLDNGMYIYGNTNKMHIYMYEKGDILNINLIDSSDEDKEFIRLKLKNEENIYYYDISKYSSFTTLGTDKIVNNLYYYEYNADNALPNIMISYNEKGASYKYLSFKAEEEDEKYYLTLSLWLQRVKFELDNDEYKQLINIMNSYENSTNLIDFLNDNSNLINIYIDRIKEKDEDMYRQFIDRLEYVKNQESNNLTIVKTKK